MHRNTLYKEDVRYLAQEQHRKRIVDLTIFYKCKPWMTEELQRQLKDTLQQHLQASNDSIDSWLQLYKSLMYASVKSSNSTIWNEMEQETLQSFDLNFNL